LDTVIKYLKKEDIWKVVKLPIIRLQKRWDSVGAIILLYYSDWKNYGFCKIRISVFLDTVYDYLVNFVYMIKIQTV